MNSIPFYEGIEINNIQTSRLATTYRHSGPDWRDAEAILMLHGSLASSAWFEPAMSSFEELMPGKYACYALDLRSHGGSETLPIKGIESLMLDVLAFMDTLEIRQVHLVGWSLSGATAILFGLEHPERCRSLTLVASPAPNGVGGLMIPASRFKVATVLNSGDREGMRRAIRAGNFREGRFPLDGSDPGNALLEYLLDSAMQTRNYPGDEAIGEGPSVALRDFDETTRIATLKVPLLNIYGDHDVIATKAFIEQSRPLWQGLNYREVLFEGSAHSPLVEQPRRFAITLDDFFSQL